MVKNRADGAPQLNLRVPFQHHDRVRTVVRLLREVDTFAARLDAVVADASGPLTPDAREELLARIAALEQAVFGRGDSGHSLIAVHPLAPISPIAGCPL